MATAREMASTVSSKRGTITMDKLEIEIEILDVRQRWGTLDYLIAPVAGNGTTWVEARRIRQNS
jgi:hypothetical protein